MLRLVTMPTGSDEGTFTLDPSKLPKEIDVAPAGGQGRLRGLEARSALQRRREPQDAALARALEEAGFIRMAQLHYLQVTPPAGSPAPMKTTRPTLIQAALTSRAPLVRLLAGSTTISAPPTRLAS